MSNPTLASSEVEINGSVYRLGRLDAFTQLKIAKRLAPGLAHLTSSVRAVLAAAVRPPKPSSNTPGDVVDPDAPADAATSSEGTEEDDPLVAMDAVTPALAEAFSKLSDEDIDFVIKTCLRVVAVKQPTGWARVTDPHGNLMIDTLNALDLVRLSTEVIKDNLGSFFRGGAPSTGEAPVPAA